MESDETTMRLEELYDNAVRRVQQTKRKAEALKTAAKSAAEEHKMALEHLQTLRRVEGAPDAPQEGTDAFADAAPQRRRGRGKDAPHQGLLLGGGDTDTAVGYGDDYTQAPGDDDDDHTQAGEATAAEEEEDDG